ncbi:ATP-binding protein [Paenibacillus radicis (ex Xue et al. 2023)]|uniref:histidine kinase n=1 Tax=Paenibacillus radicis (ex Xue et al. 2023) TaxID=2972489 RepID=A0ABT1YBI1_9BACL|nr:ATP-binding protein [Paenibacillus radicis (ex Xue et al. 2023)]MCR8630549.1 ATP-binding protein [Paenibacillus radicis (ex Xue et al. 2023)]
MWRNRGNTHFLTNISTMMTKRKIIIIIATLILLLTAIRLVWITLQATPANQPKAINGVLDLRGWNFKQTGPLKLDGQWAFYPEQLIMVNSQDTSPQEAGSQYIQVPQNWISSQSSGSTFGYGSYRLRILVDPEQDQSFGIRAQDIASSSEIFIDGRSKGHAGQPGADSREYRPDAVLYTAFFNTDKSEIDVVIHVANFHNKGMGGIVQSLLFGRLDAVTGHAFFSVGMQLLLCTFLAIHMIYTFIIFVIGTREPALLHFFMMNFCTMMLALLSDDKMLLTWVTITYEWHVKLILISLLALNAFMVQLATGLVPHPRSRRVIHLYTALCIVLILLIVAVSYEYTQLYWYLYIPVGVFAPFVLAWHFFRAVARGEHDSIYFLIGSTAIVINVIWSFVKTANLMELYFYPIDYIVTFLAFVAYWFKRYFRTAEQTKKLALKLQLADKQKDDFLANTSHELRNPLHSMLNIAQSVLDSGEKAMDGKNRRDLELLVTVGRRMSFMLGDLLDLTRLHERGIVLHKTNVTIQSLVAGVIDMLRFMTDGKRVGFVSHISSTFPQVTADENRLIQILFNLLHNAVKFTNEGTVKVEAVIREGKAHISIEDTGIGMNDETIQRIFQPYEQGNFGAGAVGGLGLGLSIVRQLVELHGGTIEAHAAPGQGSVFTFTLPLVEEAPETRERKQDHEAGGMFVLPLLTTTTEYTVEADSIAANAPVDRAADRPNLLAVDDDPLNLSILVNMLSADGYEVVTASSGQEALTLLELKQWDLVISDVMMPQMSGYELARTIRDRFTISELPILLLTARSRTEDIKAGFQSGANDYVMKPVEATELKSRVRALTDLKASVRERLRLEAAWLQAQIQPHFLFNTLNSIAALSEIDTLRMRSLLDAFGNYLKTSFHFANTEKLVPIQHELDLVRSYLFIEKERFEDRLNIVWEIDSNLQCQVPPLSIQPLVENAVRHGVCRRIRGGTVRISIAEEAGSVRIAVADDGPGIDEDKLHSLLDNSRSDWKRGIGLLNTDRRLKQLFGQGLQIASSSNEGTRVAFTVIK